MHSEDAVASDTEEVRQSLRDKHPPAPLDLSYPVHLKNVAPFNDIIADHVLAAIVSFPNGSSGGIDGLRSQHLKEMTSGDHRSSALLLESLASLVNLMISGKVPDDIVPFIYGASLTALIKKDGGIRPIAVGCTIRRLAGKIVCRGLMESMGELLRPRQMGFGSPGGCEAAVHVVRAFGLRNPSSPHVIVKFDFKNAFNCIRRDILLHKVQEFAPTFHPFVSQMYQSTTHLFFGDHLLESASGVQQGDPLGPLLFCLVIKSLTESLTSPLNTWYLDDGTIGGDLEAVCTDFSAVLNGAAEPGMSLNLSKCEFMVFGGDESSRADACATIQELSAELRLMDATNMQLLGAPLFPEAIPQFIQSKRESAGRLFQRLPLVSAHEGLFLLKNCLAIPKVMYTLRTSPTWMYREDLQRFDDDLRRAVESVTNVSMTPSVWSQASLPVRHGGLGIRNTMDLALPAYLASVYSVFPLLDSVLPDIDHDELTTEPTSLWCQLFEDAPQLPEHPSKQRLWDSPVCDLKMLNLFTHYYSLPPPADLLNVARLLSVSTPESGSWLHALPSPALGILLNDDCLRIAVALRLGADICREHRCKCGATVSPNGHHGLSCGMQAGRKPRHDAVNDLICRALVTSGCGARLEPIGLCKDDNKRPDGITSMPWSNGRHLVWDATVVDPLADTYITKSATTKRHAATIAEGKKTEKYAELAHNYLFVPLGMETLGAWGPEAQRIVAQIGKRISDRTGEPRAPSFLCQSISIAIQRGNAASILGTSSADEFEEVFSLLSSK